MKVLVCGGRAWTDYQFIQDTLDNLNSHFGFRTIIHGNALGADYLAGCWARHRGIPVIVFPADWNKYGNKAGPLRNQRMIDEGKPNLCVAFPGGRGTNDMVRRSQNAGIECYIAGTYAEGSEEVLPSNSSAKEGTKEVKTFFN